MSSMHSRMSSTAFLTTSILFIIFSVIVGMILKCFRQKITPTNRNPQTSASSTIRVHVTSVTSLHHSETPILSSATFIKNADAAIYRPASLGLETAYQESEPGVLARRQLAQLDGSETRGLEFLFEFPSLVVGKPSACLFVGPFAIALLQ